MRVPGGAAANDDAASVSDDGPPITIAVLANDIAPEIDTVLFDVETLAFADAELEIAAVDTTGTRGQVTVNPDGTIGYDPAGQFEDLASGETATDRFTYTLGNGNGGAQVTATVTVTILGAGDDGPGERSGIVARDDRATVIEDEGPVTVDVLANDTLSGPGALRVAGVTGRTEFGTVEVAPDGLGIVYRPNATLQQLGRDETETETETVAYTVVNGTGLSDTALVTFTLEGRNDAPVLIGGAQRTDADSPIFFTPLFFDTDGDRVSLSALDTSALEGAADIAFFDTLFYDPACAFDGLAAGETAIDRLTFLYSDGRGGSAAGTVEIFVEGTGAGTLAVRGAAGDDAFAFETATERRSIDGGAGTDSVRLPGMLADWIFEPFTGGHRARTADPGSGALPQELLSVETVDLDDATLRVVEDPAADTIHFLYALTYDRPADICGLSSWYAAHRDGFGLGAIADAFASAPEFDDLVGADASDADVVAALYARGLDRAGDAAGIAHWTGVL